MLRQRDSRRELISGSTADELFSGVRHSVPGPKLKPLKLLGFGGAERVLCSDVCSCTGWNAIHVTSEQTVRTELHHPYQLYLPTVAQNRDNFVL
jgi:hypothetical protein